MLQIRNMPDDTHRRLKARAALEGMSMSEYVMREIEKSLARPPRAELLRRIAELPSLDPSPSPTDVIREERESR
jgi:hypothetical protein